MTGRRARRERGFTLVEAVVVMAVTAIIAGTMVLFIRRPVQGYVDAAGRAELGNAADLGLRRIAREVRLALPNSVRVKSVGNDVLIELIPSKAGGAYCKADAVTVCDANFTVLGGMPSGSNAIVAGDYIVLFNLGPDISGYDAYAGANRAKVSVTPTGNTVQLEGGNPFGAEAFNNATRYVVTGAPVTFRYTYGAAGKGTLTRYWNYGFAAVQPDPATLNASSALLLDNVVGFSADSTALANRRSGLLSLVVTLAQPASGGSEQLTLVYQIHTDNAP